MDYVAHDDEEDEVADEYDEDGVTGEGDISCTYMRSCSHDVH